MANPSDNHAHDGNETTISSLSFDAHHPMLPADITERLAIDEQAGFFFTLIDATADAIIAHRPDGSIIYANGEAVRLLGHEEEADMLRLPPFGWIAGSHLQSAPRRLERIIAEELVTFESGARRRDGSEIPTEVRSRQIETPLGPVIIAVIRDISERVKNREALEHLAYHDGLTGLSNRIHLEERLALAIADARRYDDRLGMGYIDLDHFKPVNDRYGHAAGDDVLVQIAGRLREGVRKQDTVARLGGDEFVVLFPRLASQAEVETISERLAQRIRQPVPVDGHLICVQVSIGIALFDPHVDDARSLLVKADIAMYSAKLDPERPWMVYKSGMSLPEGDRPDHPLGGSLFEGKR